jgi:hypothetical protein
MAEQTRNQRIICHERTLAFMLRRAFVFLFVAASVSSLPARAQVSSCNVKTDLPIGVTNQNGYSFDYQSGKGPKCRRYRLRNEPGKVLTPSIWKDKTETFLDVDLAACAVGAVCPWVGAVKISSAEPDQGETTLSYGANKDECTDKPDAFRKKPVAAGVFDPLITIIEGVVADASGKAMEIKLQATSTLHREADGMFTLTYDIEVLKSMEKFRFLWPKQSADEGAGYGIRWNSAISRALFAKLKGQEWSQFEGSAPHLKASIQAKDVEIDDLGLIALYKGNHKIAATTAPAYKPKGE